jgi:hypothetical protein
LRESPCTDPNPSIDVFNSDSPRVRVRSKFSNNGPTRVHVRSRKTIPLFLPYARTRPTAPLHFHSNATLAYTRVGVEPFAYQPTHFQITHHTRQKSLSRVHARIRGFLPYCPPRAGRASAYARAATLHSMAHRIPQPGEIVWDEEDQSWWLRCPNCHDTGSLDEHQVVWNNDKPTVDGSIICEGCGDHYFIKDGEYHRA